MRIYICASVIFFSNCLSGSYAQLGPGLPVQFLQFFRTYNLINPASIGRESSIEFSTGNKSLLGDFSTIRTSYVSGNMQVNAAGTNTSKHVVGLTFINDREGSFINTNRASMLYAFHLPVSGRWTLNAGIAAGFINYGYKASNISAGGSAFAPNADIGLWLYHPDFNIGFSGNQIIPSKFTPIDKTYTLKKYYNLIADKKFLINPDLSLTSAFVFRWSYRNYYIADIALIMLIQRTLSIAVAYKYKMGASVSGGLEDIKLGRHILKMMISYYAPLGALTSYNPQSLELSLQFIPFRNHPKDEE
ncbi:MAG TPA: PorP/SprF family type IX secretion system membrane protein [Cytophagaceae bacterium]|jgi:type IX secretion system PorP/SprF family membrane protein|nr:PorP/SprF family type IX secretion system membrane protein [Cytophagaceae bacterium]